MKIAHLLLVHKSPRQLGRLVALLDHPAFDFYIHIDKKSDERPFHFLKKRPNVTFIRKRIDIRWGGYGTIAATLAGFREISTERYDYINVMSGQDLPLKSPADIHKFLSDRKGSEFITCLRLSDEWEEALPRIRDYHLVNWKMYGKYRLQKVVNGLMPVRRFPEGFVPVGRSNWFTLSAEAVRYILGFTRQNPAFVRYFHYCWGADEIMFPTILYNSHFRSSIQENLLHVDWSEGHAHPKVFTTHDLPELQNSDKLFARKFDEEIDCEVIEQLALGVLRPNLLA
ncbi:MAG: glycosyl transferase [Mucilaginibacter polytrichastri]|nr:glycosyl transferase [Mucilaginibacter polytrichastri]